MNISLSDCTLISNNEYMELENPKFEGQTRPNSVGIYYMVWESKGIYYKTANSL